MTKKNNSTDVPLKIQILREKMRAFSADEVQHLIHQVISQEATIHMCYPFGDLIGPIEYFDMVYQPLLKSIPDLERREMICVTGITEKQQTWLGTMGNYMGTFLSPFLEIPPNGHLVHMRFHEFFCIEDGKIIEVQAIWDIPELMMQARSWPMAPQLGAFLCTPPPINGDGLTCSGDGVGSMQIVKDMLTDLCRHPGNPNPEVMNLDKYWHPRFNWYGPAGIGTARGISGFRHWHQIPFLRGMPDRMVDSNSDRNSNWVADTHWISQGDYVCETGWPNMRMGLTGDGWMGIAPVCKEIFLRSLDFWKIEEGLIRENWVLVDLLDVYRQVGVDVFARLREFNKARAIQPLTMENGLK